MLESPEQIKEKSNDDETTQVTSSNPSNTGFKFMNQAKKPQKFDQIIEASQEESEMSKKSKEQKSDLVLNQFSFSKNSQNQTEKDDENQEIDFEDELENILNKKKDQNQSAIFGKHTKPFPSFTPPSHQFRLKHQVNMGKKRTLPDD